MELLNRFTGLGSVTMFTLGDLANLAHGPAVACGALVARALGV